MKTSAQSFKLLLTISLIFLITSFFVLLLNKPKFAYSAAATHIVISEIQIAGATSTDEFIELYNPTDSSVDLTGWKIMKKTSAADAEETLLASLTGSIVSHGFYLVANNADGGGFDESVTTPPDTTYSEDSIASNNSLVLRDSGDGLVDLVGMGDSLTNETASIDDPITNRSIERKAHAGATFESMATGGADASAGNGEDTDNNSLDFVRHVSPNLSQPQNTSSALEEPAGSPTVSPVETNTPTLTGTITVTPTTVPTGDGIVISEIQIGQEGTGNSGNDFIELYNPSDESFDLNGHRLVKRTSGDTTDDAIKSWTTETLIPANGYYLWANSGWAPAVTPDATTSATIAGNNGIALRFGANDTGTIIDSVAWGEANNEYAGSAAYPDNPGLGMSLERKACTSSTTDSMVNGDSLNGNSEDSGNNANDFLLREIPNPQNLVSTTEIPGCASNITPTLTPTEMPDISPTEIPTATLTPTLIPSATPTEIPSPTVTLSPSPTEGPSPTTDPTVTPTEVEESPTPTPTIEPEPTATVTPTPKMHGRVIGTFNFPGRHNRVCTLNYKVVRFFFYFIFVPQINCTRS